MGTNKASRADFSIMDDSTLLTARDQMRQRLSELPPDSPRHVALSFLYDVSTAEVTERARLAWARPR
jgi:hypothetical protein